MSHDDPRDELDALLMGLVEGELSAAERFQLAELLQEDAEARERYVKYLLVDACLAWEQSRTPNVGDMNALVALPTATAPVATSSSPRRGSVRMRQAAALAAALVLMAVPLVIVGAWRWQQPAAVVASKPVPPPPMQASTPSGESRTRTVAILTRAVNVTWGGNDLALAVGTSLPRGPFRIGSGIVQLEFYSGAIVVLEGPAEIELKSIGQIDLHSGKLRALVPPGARGFRVHSPTVDLVDMGTEFGMQVQDDREVEVQVFTGKIELHERGADPTRAKLELLEGHGARIDRSGEVTPMPVNALAFLGAPDLERLYRLGSRHRYDEWLARAHARRSDDRLLAYFSFEGERDANSRVLANGAGDRSTDGAIVGCEWDDGRWPGKGALEFKRPSDRVRFEVPGEFDSLSVVAWVRIDAVEHRYNSLMLTDEFEPGEVHWQIGGDGRIILGIRNEITYRHYNKNYVSPRVFTPERFGQWTHLATVYNHRAGTVSHYVDGKTVSSEKLARRGPLRIGAAELGNWGVPAANDSAPIRNLCGRMDEFALFDDALTAEEVRALYDQGVPSP